MTESLSIDVFSPSQSGIFSTGSRLSLCGVTASQQLVLRLTHPADCSQSSTYSNQGQAGETSDIKSAHTHTLKLILKVPVSQTHTNILVAHIKDIFQIITVHLSLTNKHTYTQMPSLTAIMQFLNGSVLSD